MQINEAETVIARSRDGEARLGQRVVRWVERCTAEEVGSGRASEALFRRAESRRSSRHEPSTSKTLLGCTILVQGLFNTRSRRLLDSFRLCISKITAISQSIAV